LNFRRLILTGATLLVVLLGAWLGGGSDPSSSDRDAVAGRHATSAAETALSPGDASASTAASEGDRLVVRDVAIRDIDGRIAWRGDVDLAPELARIAAGVRDPHRNDGGTFGNREGLLPSREGGYYREYVVRTPGISHAGPQRLVVGEGGEVFHTADHYLTFTRIR